MNKAAPESIYLLTLIMILFFALAFVSSVLARSKLLADLCILGGVMLAIKMSETKPNLNIKTSLNEIHIPCNGIKTININ